MGSEALTGSKGCKTVCSPSNLWLPRHCCQHLTAIVAILTAIVVSISPPLLSAPPRHCCPPLLSAHRPRCCQLRVYLRNHDIPNAETKNAKRQMSDTQTEPKCGTP
eukprot:551024-Rhodomonas_salina.2